MRVKIILSILSLNKFNTFASNHVYLGPNREKLPLPLQMQLFAMYIIFATFSKRIELHSLSISEITGSEKGGYLNA